MSDIINKLARDMHKNLDNWIRAVFLKELGPEWYGKDDTEIGMEARERGYMLVRDADEPFPSMKYAILKDGNRISTYVVKFNINP